MALFTGLAVAQTGPPQLQCSTNVSVTPNLRGEGYTELTADITLACTGGIAPALGSVIPTVNITVFYNTQVTSRLLPISGVSNIISEALLIIDEPGSGLFPQLPNFGPAAGQNLCATPLTGCVEYVSQSAGVAVATDTPQGTSATMNGKNVFQGVVSSNSVAFYGIPMLAPGATGTRVFRITNVRVNANPLAGGSASGASPVTASISISGATSLLLTNATPTVGFVTNGLTAGVAAAASVSHCSNSTSTSIVSFAENFGSAFKTRVVAQNNIAYAGQNGTPGLNGFASQNIPGGIYNSESAFVLPVSAGQTAGLTDFGTRLKATFNNIPAGVSLFVSVANVQTNGLPVSVPAVVGGITANSGITGFAQLTASETGPFSAVYPSIYSSSGVPSFGLPVVNGSATAVWEVINTNPNSAEQLNFAVWATYGASSSSGTGTMIVNLSYAAGPPAFNASDGANASDALPMPRFVPDGNAARNELTVADGICSGNKLSISQTHQGFQFNQGELGATYTATVTNSSAVATVGTVAVTETAPLGLTPVSMRGTGWNCGATTCSRSDALPANSSYPPITVVVNVAGDAPSLVFNLVTVSGGGDPNSHSSGSQTSVLPASSIPPTADSVTPSSGSGTNQHFTMQYTDAGTGTNFGTVWVWFNSTFAASSANSCMLYYDITASTLYLLNDAGDQWLPGTLQSSGFLQNSQCAVTLGSSSVAFSGYTLTLDLWMEFKPSFPGTKNIYMYGANAIGLNSGWQTRGTWTRPAAGIPSADSVTPASGSGSSQAFSLQYSDTGGVTNISTVWVWFNATFASSSANSCMLYYDRPANALHLINDAGTQWLSGALGVAGTLQNSQCSIDLASTNVSLGANTLMLNLATTFKPGFAGTKNVYMYDTDSGGQNSAWQTRGTWTAESIVVTADSVTPAAGSGSSQTFALQYSDTAGGANLSTAWGWFNASFASSPANSCMIYYDRAAGTYYLLNDAGTQWIQGAPGVTTTIQNSQCSVNLSASSAVISGNVLTLNLAMTFKAGYAGAKNVYMYAVDPTGANSSWQTRGTWTAQGAIVTADSVTPSSGSGTSQAFALQYSDTAGATGLSTVWAWFSPTLAASSASSCMVYYDRAAGTLYLINDAGTQWQLGYPGTTATMQNSQCSINLATSGVALSGSTLTLNLAMNFKPTFAGAKNVYMYGADFGGSNSGWQTRGTWTGTSGAATVTADSVAPSSGSGSSQTFALQYSDTAGATNLSTAWVWFSATFGSAANSCMVYYDRLASTLYLIDDAGTQWQPGTPGIAATLQNSQCSINLTGTSVALASNTLTLNLALTFKPAYAGAKNVYMYGADASTNSGWQTRGTWTATAGAAAVTADSVTPSSGSGSTQTFVLQYSDTAGVTSLSTVWVWFNATFGSAANSCMIYYDRAATTLYLINDAGTQWLPGALGSGTIENGQCSVNLTSSSVLLNGNVLTLTLAMTFKPAYAGAKTIYMYGAAGATNSGWQTRGGWSAQ